MLLLWKDIPFVFVSPFLNSCNHLSRCHWTVGKGVRLEKITSLPPGGGLLQISSRGGGQRTFLGLTFSILANIFRLRKSGNSFFGWLASWWCLHIAAAKHKNLISNLLFVWYNLMLSGKFWGLEIQHGIFGGFVGSPRDVFGVWFLPLLDHPRHLKAGI